MQDTKLAQLEGRLLEIENLLSQVKNSEDRELISEVEEECHRARQALEKYKSDKYRRKYNSTSPALSENTSSDSTALEEVGQKLREISDSTQDPSAYFKVFSDLTCSFVSPASKGIINIFENFSELKEYLIGSENPPKVKEKNQKTPKSEGKGITLQQIIKVCERLKFPNHGETVSFIIDSSHVSQIKMTDGEGELVLYICYHDKKSLEKYILSYFNPLSVFEFNLPEQFRGTEDIYLDDILEVCKEIWVNFPAHYQINVGGGELNFGKFEAKNRREEVIFTENLSSLEELQKLIKDHLK